MNRLFTRWFSAVLFVFGGQAFADIPMVTAPVILPVALVIPQLPKHSVQEFNGATEVSARSSDDDTKIIDLHAQADVSAFGTACGLEIQTNAHPTAMIEVNVFAPCKPRAVINVTHSGFRYAAQVSMTGRANLIFPAMQRDATVIVSVDEDVFERNIEIKDVEHFARIALVGELDTDPKLIASSLSGEMEIYKNRGVQVFSVDMREVTAAMTYRLTLRHHVTAENCEKLVHTRLLRILPGLAEQSQDLQLPSQDCSRIGDILELKNIVQDLKLASN